MGNSPSLHDSESDGLLPLFSLIVSDVVKFTNQFVKVTKPNEYTLHIERDSVTSSDIISSPSSPKPSPKPSEYGILL